MIFYSETRSPDAPKIDVWKMDGTKAYLRHYDQYLALNFFLLNGSREEKRDAAKELTICERKLKFWQRHPNYDHEAAMKGVAKLKARWRSSGTP